MGAAAIPYVIMGAGTLMSAYSQAKEGEKSSAYYGYLANTAKINADLARSAGEAQSRQIGLEAAYSQRDLAAGVKRTIGAQKAAIAVGGAGLSSRTAEDILMNTMEGANADEAALRFNAASKAYAAVVQAKMKAMDMETQAGGYDIAASNARDAGMLNMWSTLAGGAAGIGEFAYKDWQAGGGGKRKPSKPSSQAGKIA